MNTDNYVWKARHSPVLIAILPPSLAVLTAFPGTDWMIMLPLFTFCGLFMLVGQIGRDRGSEQQAQLFTSWGGMPTTMMLRHRDSPFDETTLSNLHTWLESATGVPAPSRRKERASPDDADKVYDSYVRYLRDATRDNQQYPLVFEENVNYGFRRNALGLRPYGIMLAVLGTVGSFFNLFRFPHGPQLGLVFASTALSGLLLLFWLFWVNPNWVRKPALCYADRLMEAALRLANAEHKDAMTKSSAADRQKKPQSGLKNPCSTEFDEQSK